MMKYLYTIAIITLLAAAQLFAQDLDVDGRVIIGTTSTGEITDSLLVKKTDGTIGTLAASQIDTGTVHYIGELFGGGIVYAVWDDGQHGLVASLANLGTNVVWSNTNTLIDSTFDEVSGIINTRAIVNAIGTNGGVDYAAQLCADFVAGGFDDWYLPAIWELKTLYQQAGLLNQVLDKSPDPDEPSLLLNAYWSSTQTQFDGAWAHNFSDGESLPIFKNQSLVVRAVRRF
ncbi:MAG: DUF1566 domain-containing protein [Bacteroidota bacterium]